MKKGITIWSFPKQSLEETFKLAKDAGYDGVELSVEKDGEITVYDYILIKRCYFGTYSPVLDGE